MGGRGAEVTAASPDLLEELYHLFYWCSTPATLSCGLTKEDNLPTVF